MSLHVYLFHMYIIFVLISLLVSDNVVCLWKLGEGGGAGNSVAMDTTTPNEENWSVTKMLR